MRGGCCRTLARAPRGEKTVCLALQLLVRNVGDPSLLALVILERSATSGSALHFEDIADRNPVLVGHPRGKTNRIRLPVLRKTHATSVTEVTVQVKFLVSRAGQHLSGRAADSAKASGERQTLGKLPFAVEALGRDEERTSHGQERFIVTAMPVENAEPFSSL